MCSAGITPERTQKAVFVPSWPGRTPCDPLLLRRRAQRTVPSFPHPFLDHSRAPWSADSCALWASRAGVGTLWSKRLGLRGASARDELGSRVANDWWH